MCQTQCNVCGEETHLGQTESGAAAHFPQATSEGNTPSGPPSLAKPRLQAQGRASQWLSYADDAMKTSCDPQTLTPAASKQAGEKRLCTVKTHVAEEALPTAPRVRLMVLISGSIVQPQIRHLPLLASMFAFHLVLKEAHQSLSAKGCRDNFPSRTEMSRRHKAAWLEPFATGRRLLQQ